MAQEAMLLLTVAAKGRNIVKNFYVFALVWTRYQFLFSGMWRHVTG